MRKIHGKVLVAGSVKLKSYICLKVVLLQVNPHCSSYLPQVK